MHFWCIKMLQIKTWLDAHNENKLTDYSTFLSVQLYKQGKLLLTTLMMHFIKTKFIIVYKCFINARVLCVQTVHFRQRIVHIIVNHRKTCLVLTLCAWSSG